ncbi:MAG: FAD-binding oxidoreductase [Actinomycetota bacterium]|nr:FAD-binding oxidoreductase [Actinomycetota bacterium]
MTARTAGSAKAALADAAPVPFWTDRPDRPEAREPLRGTTQADLLIVGGGFTGLWAAIEASDRGVGDVAVVEAEEVGFGASGRNGGFLSESLTHGLAHGEALWGRELRELTRLGRQNVSEILEFCRAERIDAKATMCGKSTVATRPHHLAQLQVARDLHLRHGEQAELLDGDQMRADVDSPTYLGGLKLTTGSGLLDPALLCWGLKSAALRRGVRIYEHTSVHAMRRSHAGIQVTTSHGSVHARKVLLATNAYPPLLRRLRHRILPIFDHVLVTEQLSERQRASVGWRDGQGLTDIGNQFHYYRRTPDDRILWGGYDAIYYFGNRTDAWREQRDASHALLAQQFTETFPQLEGVQFTHRWAGLIDSTSRFTPVFGTAMSGRLAYSVGFTGLGVAASRFGSGTALDLLEGRDTERTRLQMVRRKPIPFPPEPLRYPTVQFTRRSLAREDATGQRGLYLRTLDRFGIGFNS